MLILLNSLFCQVHVKSSFEVKLEWDSIQQKQIHQKDGVIPELSWKFASQEKASIPWDMPVWNYALIWYN